MDLKIFGWNIFYTQIERGISRMKVKNVRGLKQGITLIATALCAGILTCLGYSNAAAAQLNATGSAAPAAQIKPVVSINVLMVSFVDQAADAIWTAAANPPKKACEWEQVEYRAIQLATTGTLLKVGGTGPKDLGWTNSPAWAPFADRMTEMALAAAQAAKNKDLAAIKTVGDELILNCEGCHRAFKPDIPSQGIITHLSHARPLSEGLGPKCRDK